MAKKRERFYQFVFTNGHWFAAWFRNKTEALEYLYRKAQIDERCVGNFQLFHIKKGEDLRGV